MSSKDGVNIVVCGAESSGKTSLITAAATESFPETVAPKLPVTRLPGSTLQDGADAFLIDTSSRQEDRAKRIEECHRAHVIVMTYAVDDISTLRYLSRSLLPALREEGITVPIVLVGCKLDKRPDGSETSEAEIVGLMNDFREIETCLECSAKKLIQVAEVVLYATKAVLHPTRPLFDTQTQQLKPRCVRALRHIFKLCDLDGDGVLNDQELNDFQVACFNTPLQPDEIRGVKKVVEEKLPSGVDEKGLTLRGFLFLHALFIERGRMETTWAVLRKFGYNNQLVMDEAHLTVSFERRADQCVELTDQATDFLTSIFHRFDKDGKGSLSGLELEELFATAPCSPWEEPRWARCAEITGVHGALTLSGFMAQWALTTLLEPEKMLAYLHYLGFTADQTDPQVAFRISKRRIHEKRKGRFSRNIFKCVVFGAPGAGKSALLDSLIGQPFREVLGGAKASERMAVAALETEGLPPSKRMLAMLEPEPATAAHLLQSPEDLQTYDVATFVFDSSSPTSFRATSAQLSAMVQMDCEVPCVLVAAKDDAKGISKDLNEEVALLCTSLNMSLPVSISIKDGDLANIHSRILHVAMHPDEFVPKTAAMRASAAYRKALTTGIAYMAAGAGVTVVCMVAWRIYASKRSAT